MQKARRHPISGLRPLVSVWFQVLFHPLIQGTFHLSLKVLVHYRSLRSIQPYQMVLADSNGISPVPPYSGYHSHYNLTCTGLSPFIACLPRQFQFNYFCQIVVLQPQYCRNNTGLGSSLFARHYLGNHQLFSLPPVTQMFQFTGFATIAGRYVFNIPGCPIQTFTDQVSSADPRNFSQLGTSFFASESLGIPHAPLFIFFN